MTRIFKDFFSEFFIFFSAALRHCGSALSFIFSAALRHCGSALSFGFSAALRNCGSALSDVSHSPANGRRRSSRWLW
ncbi:MAG: hypothetical protein U9Q82_09650, partial [Chloroflexota bacterium]|nr:hypothetical protein [Chloroflexota bacterium]